jgi:hypothetical protein
MSTPGLTSVPRLIHINNKQPMPMNPESRMTTTSQLNHVTDENRRVAGRAICQSQADAFRLLLFRRSWGGRLPFLAILLALPWFMVNTVRAQESLRDAVQSQGAEWMLGHWTGTNAQGRSVEVEYEWELEGHAIEVDLSIGDDGYKGIIFRKQPGGEVVEVGADSRGGMTHSTWRLEDGAVITDRTGTRPGGQVIRVAVVFQRLDGETAIATMHSLSAEGERGEAALDTVRLRRVADPEEKE